MSNKCPKCTKTVYQMEEIGCGNLKWHKTCFKCEKCSSKLSHSTACRSADDKLYCKRCYKEGIFSTKEIEIGNTNILTKN